MTETFVEILSETVIAERVAELGAAITADYDGKDPVVVGVLHGSLPFLTDLSRHLPTNVELDFMALTRFGEQGRVSIAMDISTSVAGRDVLIVEDIVDTGLTLTTLRRLFEARNVSSLAVASLLDKSTRRIVNVDVEYRGFEVGDEFLLGYGLDWEGQYRNIRSLWAVLDLVEFQADPSALARTVFTPTG